MLVWRPLGKDGDSRFRVALLGNIFGYKGIDVLRAVAKYKPDTDFVVIGRAGSGLPKNVIVLGHYEEDDVFNKIAQVSPHAFWFASIFPESYSYTATIALKTGIPILYANHGAFTERLGDCDALNIGYDPESDTATIAGALDRFKFHVTEERGTRLRLLDCALGEKMSSQSCRIAFPNQYLSLFDSAFYAHVMHNEELRITTSNNTDKACLFYDSALHLFEQFYRRRYCKLTKITEGPRAQETIGDRNKRAIIIEPRAHYRLPSVLLQWHYYHGKEWNLTIVTHPDTERWIRGQSPFDTWSITFVR